MTRAADDADAIRAARELIPHQRTTDDTPPTCERCGGYTFVLDGPLIGARTRPCPVCRPRPPREEPKP